MFMDKLPDKEHLDFAYQLFVNIYEYYLLVGVYNKGLVDDLIASLRSINNKLPKNVLIIQNNILYFSPTIGLNLIVYNGNKYSSILYTNLYYYNERFSQPYINTFLLLTSICLLDIKSEKGVQVARPTSFNLIYLIIFMNDKNSYYTGFAELIKYKIEQLHSIVVS